MNKNEYCEDDRLDLSEYDNWTKEEIETEIARLEAIPILRAVALGKV